MKGANFLRSVVGVFVETGQGAPPQAAEPPAFTAGPAPRVAPTARPDIGKFQAHFAELFKAMDKPGPDYYEFWLGCQSLQEDIPDERARMRATFRMLEKQGLTKDRLIATAKEYTEGIEGDRTKYTAAIESARRAEVTPKQQEADSLKASMQSDLKQIEALKAGLASTQKRIDQLLAEVDAAEDRIASSQSGYSEACDAMVSKISADVASISSTIN